MNTVKMMTDGLQEVSSLFLQCYSVWRVYQ